MTQPSYLTGRRNVHDSPWTAERDAVLTRMWAEGYSASQIADQIMGVTVSRSAVIGRAHRLKLPARQERKRSVSPSRRKPRIKIFEPKPKPKALPTPPAQPGAPKMRGLSLLDLKSTSCRWPIGDGPYLFCGADAAADAVYCPFHRRTARVRDKCRQ